MNGNIATATMKKWVRFLFKFQSFSIKTFCIFFIDKLLYDCNYADVSSNPAPTIFIPYFAMTAHNGIKCVAPLTYSYY